MPWPMRAGHHVVAEHRFQAARAGGAHAQHLLARHQHDVAGAHHGGGDQQRRRRCGEGEARAGDRENGGAEPGGLRVVAAVDLAADADRDQDRADREGRGDQAEPDDRQVELDGAVGRGDAHHRGDELHQHGADEQRHQQAEIGVAGAEAGGELFEHRSARLAHDAPGRPGRSAWIRNRETRAAGRTKGRGIRAGTSGRRSTRSRSTRTRRRRRSSSSRSGVSSSTAITGGRAPAPSAASPRARVRRPAGISSDSVPISSSGLDSGEPRWCSQTVVPM